MLAELHWTNDGRKDSDSTVYTDEVLTPENSAYITVRVHSSNFKGMVVGVVDSTTMDTLGKLAVGCGIRDEEVVLLKQDCVFFRSSIRASCPMDIDLAFERGKVFLRAGGTRIQCDQLDHCRFAADSGYRLIVRNQVAAVASCGAPAATPPASKSEDSNTQAASASASHTSYGCDALRAAMVERLDQ